MMHYIWVTFKPKTIWTMYHRYSLYDGDRTRCGKQIIGARLDTTNRPSDEYRCKRCTTLSTKDSQ